MPSNPDVAAFGLFAPEEGVFVANGTVKVRLDGAETQIANGVAIRVHVCTVSAGAADLSNVLVGVHPKGYACKIEKETLANGLVRYSAVFERQGLTIMVR